MCANQAKTERAPSQEPRLFKILCLVPVVWLLECVSPQKKNNPQKTKEKKKLARAACGSGGDVGAGSPTLFLFKFVALALQRLCERRVCHPDDEEHKTRSPLP